MPKPVAGESKRDFIKRCMEMLVGQEGRDSKQAYAICNSLWDEHQGGKQIEEINNDR
jgi:hypothetical protein